MRHSNKLPKSTIRSASHKKPNLSRWFWGTIALLLLITVSLELLASWQVGRQGVENDIGSLLDRTGEEATRIEQWFETAGNEAEKVSEQLPGWLDDAYAPVYAGIPRYMDFHYSLTGEWLELGSAAMGTLGSGLEKHLFDGFDARLGEVSERIVQKFDQMFWMTLDEAMAAEAGGSAAFRPVVTRALRDSQDRMKNTAGTAGSVLVGGATLKLFTKSFAKKISIKLAAKVGTKTGMKWAAAASGGAVSAAACSWTGPGAAACAVIGATITWVATDVAMIKLDEYVTRDVFERDLRELIDDHKIATQIAMERIIANKMLAVEKEGKRVVRDVSLSELPDADRLLACEAAASILDSYNIIRGNLQARSPANIASLHADLRRQETNRLLSPWVASIKAVITDHDLRPWISGSVKMNVSVPTEIADGRSIWGRLRLAGVDIEFSEKEGDSAGNYSLEANVEKNIIIQGKQLLEFELFQDMGWTSWNRDYKGTAWLDFSKNVPEGTGLTPKAVVPLIMASGNEDVPPPLVEVVLSPHTVRLPVSTLPEFCMQ